MRSSLAKSRARQRDVVVEEDHDVAAGVVDADVALAGQARLGLDVVDWARLPSSKAVTTGWRRSCLVGVDDDDLVGRRIVSLEARERGVEDGSRPPSVGMTTEKRISG